MKLLSNNKKTFQNIPEFNYLYYYMTFYKKYNILGLGDHCITKPSRQDFAFYIQGSGFYLLY